MGCSKPDRDDEAVALSTKIVSEGLSDANHALERVDSAVIVIGTGAWVYPDLSQRLLLVYYSLSLSARLISCDALCYVILEVVVEE